METNRDKALRGEVVHVTFARLVDMQRQAIAGEGVGYEDYHWHWVAVINELIALRASGSAHNHQRLHAVLTELVATKDLHDQLEVLKPLPPAREEEYRRRRVAAWAAARAALTAETIPPRGDPQGLYECVEKMLQSDCAPETWAVLKRFMRFFPSSEVRSESDRPSVVPGGK